MTLEPTDATQSASSFQVVALHDGHLAGAAELFTAGYRAARLRVPLLPARHEDAEAIALKLRQLAEGQPGVAAIRDGLVVGYLLGQVMPDFRGRRSIYVPEWAHGADGPDRSHIYREMYAALSPKWIDDGCCTHLITVLADQQDVLDAFFWLGFGMICVDAMRDLRPVNGRLAQIEIRRAGSADSNAVLEFAGGIQRHMAEAPMFIPLTDPVDMETIDKRLADPAQAIFLAFRDNEPVAYIHIQPASTSAAYVILDAKTASIRGAFARESYRGKGITTVLLSRAIKWARSAGYERCSVDFESQNIPGHRFWQKHFQPVCYSVIRHIDERMFGDREGRTA